MRIQWRKLAKPFSQIGVAGSVVSLLALSAKAVQLLVTEKEGREKLQKARENLHSVSVILYECFVEILKTDFQDEVLIGLVFAEIDKCWEAAVEVEQYVLKNWAVRVWHADDVEMIKGNVDQVRERLLSVRTSMHVAKQKACSGPIDKFQPSFPDPEQLSAGLLPRAAEAALNELKSRVIRASPSESVTASSNAGDKVVRVALTSVSGEGGVGKTSACKLLCADPEVQKHFSDGAILWIDLGSGVTDVQVRDRISGMVMECGGRYTAERVDSCDSVETAVMFARQFFSSHRILLVLDNVWKPVAESIVDNWFGTLSRIAKCAGSVVVMTTRFADLSSAPGMGHVRFGRLDLTNVDHLKIAEELYDQQLSMEPNNNPVIVQMDEYKKIRAQALKLSCGLPLGIATFCGLIRMRGSGALAVLALIDAEVMGRWFGVKVSWQRVSCRYRSCWAPCCDEGKSAVPRRVGRRGEDIQDRKTWW